MPARPLKSQMSSLGCLVRRSVAMCSIGMLALVLAVGACLACDTPVYRYAMYRWQPAPYEVYYFHDGPVDEKAKRIAESLEKWSLSRTDAANVLYIDVDVQQDPQLQRVPADVRQLWQGKPDRKVPGYLVMTPVRTAAPPSRAAIFDGQLQEESLESMVHSPLLKKLTDRLAAGDACVFILLGGVTRKEGADSAVVEDEQATAQAQQTLQQVVDDVNAGKVQLYAGPASGGRQADQVPHQVSMLPLSRLDPQEKWLIDTLMSVEDDLPEFDTPMVFAVYGRARVLPPYIGKGVRRELLLECVEFVTGACSCTVKEQNPGMDLLVRNDWETTSAAVAAKFGAEEGNEAQLNSADLFPELVVPPPAQSTSTSDRPDRPAIAADSDSASSPGTAQPLPQRPPVDVDAQPTPAVTDTVGDADEQQENPSAYDGSPKPSAQDSSLKPSVPSDTESSAPTQQSSANPTPDEPAQRKGAASSTTDTQVASAHNYSPNGADSSSLDPQPVSTRRGLLVVLGGIGVGLLILMAITFVVIRSN